LSQWLPLSNLAFPSSIPPIPFKPTSPYEIFRFSTIQYLCRRPPIISAGKKDPDPNSTELGRRENAATFSDLDNFVVAEGTSEERGEVRTAIYC